MNEERKKEIVAAFKVAIEEIGLEAFKKTSIFGSNETWPKTASDRLRDLANEVEGIEEDLKEGVAFVHSQYKGQIADANALVQKAEKINHDLTQYIRAITKTVHEKHFSDNTKWELSEDGVGTLTQLDNMLAGMARFDEDMFTGITDVNGTRIYEGNIVMINNAGPHTNKEYWNPEFRVVWEAPSYVLEYIGGGKKGDGYMFSFRTGNVEVIE